MRRTGVPTLRDAVSVLVTCCLGLSACARVIGIDDAREDPTFSPGAEVGGEGGFDPRGGAKSGGEGGASGGAPLSEGGRAGSVSNDPCAEYCTTVIENCKAPYAVYTSLDTCLAVCAVLPPGNPNDQIGNSVACRLRNAKLAKSTAEPDVHCPIAGPGGADVCGSNCEGYCVILSEVCSVSFGTNFESLVDCHQQCAMLPDPVAFEATQNKGNTVGCRLWHSSAASLDPGTHCAHASGAPPCAQ